VTRDITKSDPTETEPDATPAVGHANFWSRHSEGKALGNRVLAVFNPAAGDTPSAPDTQSALLARLQAGLAAHALHLDRLAFAPKQFPGALHERLGADLRAIIVLGGDGTVLAVVEALNGAQIPIGILPRGTMNWLARDLGLPPDPEQALDALLNPSLRHIDLGRVNGRPFLCACMIGVAALLARDRERLRAQPRWRRWPELLLKAVNLWGRYPHLRMHLVTDGAPRQLRSRTLVVVNNRVEPALRLLPLRPRLDEGLLALYAMRRAAPRRLRSLLGRLMSGSWNVADVLLSETGACLRIELPGIRALPVLLDGEIQRLHTPLEFRVEAAAVPVLTPAR
jgi:diacylglycerol kinase family enzyme